MLRFARANRASLVVSQRGPSCRVRTKTGHGSIQNQLKDLLQLKPPEGFPSDLDKSKCMCTCDRDRSCTSLFGHMMFYIDSIRDTANGIHTYNCSLCVDTTSLKLHDSVVSSQLQYMM